MNNQPISILDKKTDHELVSLACQPNKMALDILLHRYNLKTQLLVHRYVDNSVDVQDISQEVLIKLPAYALDSTKVTF